MTQKCKVTFGNISKGQDMVRVFESKNQAMVWINHEMVRNARLPSCHELFFRLESCDDRDIDDFVLPF